MYHPKKVFTKDGYATYLAHLNCIEAGLFYIRNHEDDLHIGAKNAKQLDDWLDICWKFEDLLPILKKGDGEKYE